jgi:hypothetical protein
MGFGKTGVWGKNNFAFLRNFSAELFIRSCGSIFGFSEIQADGERRFAIEGAENADSKTRAKLVMGFPCLLPPFFAKQPPLK